MQRYRWPGHDVHLLRELQRQQNNAQFCDTLLQTEGISVPTHSCILAALSPYLSQRLSASLSPPSGQKRQLRLQSVTAQTLLKLVGLLYSGEVDVKGSVEQNDVLSAAHQFGITDLVEGQKDVRMKEGEPQKKSCWSCRERCASRKMQDAQVQAEMAGRRAMDCPVGNKSSISTGTQTVKAGENTAGSSFSHSGQTKPPTRQPASPGAQSSDFSITLKPPNITLDKYFYSTSSSLPPCMFSGAPHSGESTLDQSSDSVTNPTTTSAWPNNVTFPVSLNDDSNSPIPQEDGSCQQSSEFGDRIEMGSTEQANAKMALERENAGQPSSADRNEVLGVEKGAERLAHVGRKSLATMKRMQQTIETTQISIKVKLVRTEGEVWEVVRMEDADETLSVPTSLTETDLANSELSSARPETVQSNTVSSPGPPPANTTSDSQLVCSDCFTPDQNNELESALLGQSAGPAEESDEQIEKLLEDIMMTLNILPNFERDCKKSCHLQRSHDRTQAVRHMPVSKKEQYYQSFGTQMGHSSIDTALLKIAHRPSSLSSSSNDLVRPKSKHNTNTQNQPSCSRLPSMQSVAPQCCSSYTSMRQRDGAIHQDTSLAESQNCPHPEAPTAFYTACQEPSLQDGQGILELLPLKNGNKVQSLRSVSLPGMDDLRLPRCLSPLEPFTWVAKPQPVFSNSANRSDDIHAPPSLRGPPWLTDNPGSLQFPLNAVTHIESVSSVQNSNHSCWSKQQQTRAESYTVEQGRTVFAGDQNVTEGNSENWKMTELLRCKQDDTTGAAVPNRRKRKRPTHSKDAAGPRLAHKDIEVSYGTKSLISRKVCSVSLSSNNVLAKEREMSFSSSDDPKRFLEPSTITECRSEKTRGTRDLKTDRTWIRTGGFLKKTQETPSNTAQESSSFLSPVVHTAKIVNEQGCPTRRRKRGRPLKTKHEGSPADISEKKSHAVPSEQQMDNNLPKEEGEKGEKKRCKRWRRNKSKVEVIPQKKTKSAGKAEVDINNDMISAERELGTSKSAVMVNLNEFQKVFDRQSLKTKKPKESKDKNTDETARDVESEEEEYELLQETHRDVTEAQNGDEIKEPCIFNVTVDKNHNQIFNKLTADGSKSQQDKTNSSSGDELHENWSSLDVLGEEEAKTVVEREQPTQNPDEAEKACEAVVSDTTQLTAISDEGLSHKDTHTLPQAEKTSLRHKLDPKTPERIGPPLPNAVVFSRSSEAVEEEEEVEVDVLLYTPVPESRVGENGLDNMDIFPEEEEEEDVNEIDVTGDEAE